MRLHDCVEQIERDWSGVSADAFEAAQFFRLASERVVTFDFGDVTGIPGEEWIALQDYGLDLMALDRFALPYGLCAFCYRADGIDMVALLTMNNGSLHGYFFTFKFRQLGFFDVALMDLRKSGETKRFAITYRQVLGPAKYGDKEAADCATIHTRNAVALNCLLSARGVTTKRTPAPEKLNRQRLARGKTPIGEVMTVFINVRGVTHDPSGRMSNGKNSPRMHWRRGHIRRLASGKISNVRPCLVGAVADHAVPMPNYAVEVD